MKTAQKKTVIGIRVDDKTLAVLRNEASAVRRSISEFIRIIIEEKYPRIREKAARAK